MITMTLQQVIITTDNVDVGTVDNQENVEPDNRKDPARFSFIILIFHLILMTLTPTPRMTDLELKRRNRRESNQIQKTQEGMVSFISSSIIFSVGNKTRFNHLFKTSLFWNTSLTILIRWAWTQQSWEGRRQSTIIATQKTLPRWLFAVCLLLFVENFCPK